MKTEQNYGKIIKYQINQEMLLKWRRNSCKCLKNWILDALERNHFFFLNITLETERSVFNFNA